MGWLSLGAFLLILGSGASFKALRSPDAVGIAASACLAAAFALSWYVYPPLTVLLAFAAAIAAALVGALVPRRQLPGRVYLVAAGAAASAFALFGPADGLF